MAWSKYEIQTGRVKCEGNSVVVYNGDSSTSFKLGSNPISAQWDGDKIKVVCSSG